MNGSDRPWPIRALRAVGRFAVALVVVGYTVLDELLTPLVRPIIRWLSGLHIFKRIEAWLKQLPHYAALVALAVPFAIVEPVKLAAVWWTGSGHVVSGIIGLVLAHLLSLLVVERIFYAVYEQLMRIGWFAALLGWLFGIRDRAIAILTSTRAWQTARRWARQFRAWVRRLLARLR